MSKDTSIRPYRGKRTDNGEWVMGYLIGHDVIVGDLVEFNDEYFNCEFWCRVHPETVGQMVYDNRYTGDIFAVVCDCDAEYGCSHGTENWMLVWHEQYFQYGFRRGARFVLLDEFGEENVHLIGPIHDHPNLLGAGR